MPLLSWIRLIDVHQNAVFEMGKNRWRARVTENRCKVPLTPKFFLSYQKSPFCPDYIGEKIIVVRFFLDFL